MEIRRINHRYKWASRSPMMIAKFGYVKEPEGLESTLPKESVYDHALYPGETLNDVAKQYGGSKDAIMQRNNITDELAVGAGVKLLAPVLNCIE
ncbi:MAG: LysM domain-containing protein [Kiritimatiellales bacterium]